MPIKFRRFEILLPLRFNDGSEVPTARLAEATEELVARFDAVSIESQVIVGSWRHAGTTYRDRLARVFVDVPDTDENRAFFAAWKERLKAQFAQLEIWITSHAVDVL